MEKLIALFPENLVESVNIANNLSLTKKQNISNVVFCGMGGSGISGLITSKWVQSSLKVPFQIVQDYSLPNYVNNNTLLIVSSYSGETEETLYCLKEGIKKNATIVGITSGGTIAEICKEHKFDCVTFTGGNPPRSALGYSLVQTVNVLNKFELTEPNDFISQIKTASSLLKNNISEIKEKAKETAQILFQNNAIIYSDAKYEGIAIRFKQQLNENSKMLCSHNVVPEMNHNELVGWGTEGNENAVIFLDSQDSIIRNQIRLDYTKSVVESKTSKIISIQAKGDSFIEKSLYYIHLLDWVSLYLSELNQVDIMDIKVINELKSKLSLLNH